MMKHTILAVLMMGALSLSAAEMPSWVGPALNAANQADVPQGFEYWTLHDETIITYQEDGSWLKERRVVRKVLLQSGGEEASRYNIGGNQDTTKIKKLSGWHQHASGKVDKLDRDNVATIGMSQRNYLNRDQVTAAFFERVGRGAVVAFESREIVTSYFRLDSLFLMDEAPVLRRVVELRGSNAHIKTLNFEAWGLKAQTQGNRIEITNIPGLQDERIVAQRPDAYPILLVGFYPDSADSAYASWDNFAKWYYGVFNNKALGGAPATAKASSVEDVKAMAAWMRQTITYRQRYLSDARGWEPEAGEKVARFAYGDCKDMVSCFAYKMKSKDIAIYPVLANIGSGHRTTKDDLPRSAFNHLIAAIPLSQSLGLQSEVKVGDNLYLIYDPTDRYTNIGKLGSQFEGRDLMVCRPDGADWISVPETALEPAKLELMLAGSVDANYTMSGVLNLTENGDATGLRSSFLNGNSRDLEWTIRTALDIPGVVELVGQEPTVSEDGRLEMSYQVYWPAFFQRDAGGIRFPHGITGEFKVNLKNGGLARQQPIGFTARPLVQWNIDLSVPSAFKARKTDISWDDAYSKLSWKAETGRNLSISFSRSRKDGFFGRDALSEGMDYWKTHRRNMQDFLLNAAVFYP